MRTDRSLLITLFLALAGGALPFAGCSSSGNGTNASAGGEAGAGGVTSAASAVGEGGDATAGGAAGATSVELVGGAGGEGGADGAAGAGGEGGGAAVCDPTAEDAPDDDFADTNCDGIDGDVAHAVFVSPNGRDDASGAMAQPVATISRALAMAAQKHADIYVCNGTYRDNVVIKSGVNIFGGYDCARNWVRVKDRAVVQPVEGFPLMIDSVPSAVLVDRIAFRAGKATHEGQSSQAGGIVNSAQVRLSHVEFLAGDGAKGAPGTPGAAAPSEPPPAAPDGANGSPVSCVTTSASTRNVCDFTAPGGHGGRYACEFNGGIYETTGGPGGSGSNPWLDQQRALCLSYESHPLPGAAGSYQYAGVLRFRSTDEDIVNGFSGAGATTGIGQLNGVLYVASNAGSPGTTGRPGMPGKGGDGGKGSVLFGDPCAYKFSVGSGGGQGGVGGCGGQGGNGGHGGGASIALVVVNSKVTLEWSRLATGNGGEGGDGAPGGSGQPGGPGGNAGACSDVNALGQPGAPGTAGGIGGSGGAGGGGPSIGVLYVGAAPVVSNVEFSLGVPGNGGPSAGGSAAAIGVTAQMYALEN